MVITMITIYNNNIIDARYTVFFRANYQQQHLFLQWI